MDTLMKLKEKNTKKFKLELLGSRDKQDIKDGLQGVKNMYPEAKVKTIKTKNKIYFEVIENVKR